jgi:hypothetical protein
MVTDGSQPLQDSDLAPQRAQLSQLAARKLELAHELASYRAASDARIKVQIGFRRGCFWMDGWMDGWIHMYGYT